MAVLLTVGGGVRPLTETLTLPVMQRLVDGYLEVVTLRVTGPRRTVLIVDEEGRLKEKPINQRATDLYRSRGGDFIVGDAILCTIVNGGKETERVE